MAAPARAYLYFASHIYILRCSKTVRGNRRRKELKMSIKFITAKVSAWRRYRSAVRELEQLSDRELHDLGITRYDIEVVARQSAGL